MNKSTVNWVLILSVAFVGAYFAWKFIAGGNETSDADKSGGKNKPVTVEIIVAKKQDYPVKLSANGIVSSLNIVEVRSQISSVIAKVHIKEGQFVKAGDVLFTLDSRAEQVALQKAQAQLDKELATLSENQRQLQRSKELFEKKFQSQSTVDSSNTIAQAQQSIVDAAKAAVSAAKVNLSYSRIVAPASGRTGLINVYTGSLVQPSSTGSALVTITQMHPIAISFPLPQRNLNDALASMKRGDSFALAKLPESNQVLKGQLQFVDNVVDPASGTVKVKAVFENKAMLLWPGAYANVELSLLTIKDAIVVPQEALVVGAKATSIYVVDAQGKAELRLINVEHSFGKEALVSGIANGDKIIVEGKQNLRPGASLKIRGNEEKKESPSAEKTPAAKASASAS